MTNIKQLEGETHLHTDRFITMSGYLTWEVKSNCQIVIYSLETFE